MNPEQVAGTATNECDVHDPEFITPEFLRDPYPTYERLRESCPVARCGQWGEFWMVSRYEDVRAAARDVSTFASGEGTILPPLGNPAPFLPMECDPPEHTQYRKALQPWFSMREMTALEPAIREVVDELIDVFLARGEADLATELADKLPLIAIALLLGLPREDWTMFSEKAVKMVDAASAENFEGALSVAFELIVYLGGRIEEDRRTPQGGFISRLIAAEINGAPISDEALMSLTFFLLMAGHETTVGSIGAMLLQVGQDPELKKRLIDQPELIERAIEESLRLSTPVQALARTTTRDVSVNGIDVKAGERVMLAWASANRDPTTFPDPDRFDLDRPHNNHLAFGDGIHRCVGANLGRVEMRVVLEQVLRRIPDYRVLDPDAIEIVGFTHGRKVVHLPVAW